VGSKKLEDLKSVKTVHDGSVFPAVALPTATVLQISTVLQSVSEWVQNLMATEVLGRWEKKRKKEYSGARP
jgi:hypothetical protein